MKLTGFALGIRTVRSFKVEDKLGSIVDEILYSKNSKFNEKLFPEVRENYNTKLLFDPIKLNRFKITPQDFIFEYNIEKDFEKDLELYLNSFKSIILDKLFSEFNIKNIQRFGFVVKTELDKNDKFLNEISDKIKEHKGTDDSISLRFNVVTKRPLKLEKIITEDYDNEIITYDRPDAKSKLSFSVDYQKYFKPVLNIIGDATVPFDTFCNNSFAAFNEKYFGKK